MKCVCVCVCERERERVKKKYERVRPALHATEQIVRKNI
jgi:hypothetical protein